MSDEDQTASEIDVVASGMWLELKVA
jgi:hypothetical protein